MSTKLFAVAKQRLVGRDAVGRDVGWCGASGRGGRPVDLLGDRRRGEKEPSREEPDESKLVKHGCGKGANEGPRSPSRLPLAR